MQSYLGSTKALRCFDCKSDFSSAASLLHHFADHTFENDANNDELVNLFCEIMSRLQHCSPAYIRKKLKSKQSPEHPSKHWAHASSSTLGTSRIQDGAAPSTHPSSGDAMTMEDDAGLDSVPISNILTEIGVRAKNRKHECSVTGDGDVTLVKCSLQERLENCIIKLSTRQIDSTLPSCENIGNGLLTPSHLMQAKLPCGLPSSSMSNPMNFCFLTTNGIAGHSGATCSTPKSSSWRKQASPRKVVHRISSSVEEDGSAEGDAEGQGDTSQPEQEAGGGAVPTFLECYDGRVAPGKKKYPCHLCSKTFGWSTDLKRHILTHTGERPFKCGLCQATFTRNFLLQKHEAKFHDAQAGATGSRESPSALENGRLAQYRQSVARKLGNTAERRKTDSPKVSKTKGNPAVRANVSKKGGGSQAKSVLPSNMSSPEALNIS